MDGKTVGIIAVIIIVLVGGWILLSGSSSPAPIQGDGTVPATSGQPTVTNPVAAPAPAATPVKPASGTTSTTTTTTTTTTTSITPGPAGVTVVYSNQGFSPASISVTAGTRVTFVNQSTERMWVASDPHPTHQGYDGTTVSQHCASGYIGAVPFDECTGANSYSFVFTKAGSWGYHNHASAGNRGNVTVTAPKPI